ncbi:MAG: putative S-layer protein [Nanoarchaeota archaeon]|nr:putative S-layer protein [Nanoarchaeota archaeon]
MKNMKLFSVLFLALFVLAIANVQAAFVDVVEVEVEDTEIHTSGITILDLERGNEFEVEVTATALGNYDDVQMEISLYGIHSEHVTDITGTFDMDNGTTYTKKLTLELPDRTDVDEYTLRVRFEDRVETQQETYQLSISSQRNDMMIKDVVFSPGTSVKQGRALLTTVRVKNMGDRDEEGVKVTFEIPELGLKASDFLDDVEFDDSETSEELYVKIPNCAEAGAYEYNVIVEYDDGDEEVTQSGMIYVTEGDICDMAEEEGILVPTTLVTVGPATQDVKQGVASIYPVTLSNTGNNAKTYMVSVDGVSDWGKVSIDPAASVVLQPGESKAVYVYVTADEKASEGEHIFTLSINSGTLTLKQVALKANVLKGDNGLSLKKVLEVGLVVLVVLLIILALIVAFNKLKGKEDEEDANGETYY